MFYWTRGNDSVKGLDTLRLAQYSVESYHTSVSEAVYETGRIDQFAKSSLCQYVNSPLHVELHRCVFSQDNTPSWCCILPCVGTCCSLSWRPMFPPFYSWFSPGSPSGSVSPLSLRGPALVSTAFLPIVWSDSYAICCMLQHEIATLSALKRKPKKGRQ